MSASIADDSLPYANSPSLHLSHPTPQECIEIWTDTSVSWKDSLTLQAYLEESHHLTNIPLAKDNGLTLWILVDKSLPPNKRPILCSCESFRKRSVTSDADGNVEDNIVHGVASVFCAPKYRGRGYATRHMREMARALHSWQSEGIRCVGSILYSDIGKTYYAKLGWHPTPMNSHAIFQPLKSPEPLSAKALLEADLAKLCERDEEMIRQSMAKPAETKMRLSIVPDLDHILWHMGKESFATQYLFEKVPQVKGAIAGFPGSRVWAIWTHRYYDHPDTEGSENVLHILRLVIEDHDTDKLSTPKGEEQDRRYHEQACSVKAVLQAAQSEGFEWKLDCVKLWNPTPVVQSMIDQSGIEYSLVDREEDSIASGLWYDEHGGAGPSPEWLHNEHYAWC